MVTVCVCMYEFVYVCLYLYARTYAFIRTCVSTHTCTRTNLQLALHDFCCHISLTLATEASGSSLHRGFIVRSLNVKTHQNPDNVKLKFGVDVPYDISNHQKKAPLIRHAERLEFKQNSKWRPPP